MKRIFIAPLLLGVIALHAQSPLNTKKVTVFKNATALVVKEGTAPVKNGNAVLPIPDQALFGTYFIGTGKDNSVKNIVFRNDTIKKQSESKTVQQYLAGNINKMVTISYSPTQGVDKSITGKVVNYDLRNGILKFVTDKGNSLILNEGSIYQADFKEDPSGFYLGDSIKRMIVLRPDKPADNMNLQEVYMTGGINWLPSYYLRLKDDKNARIEMKATLENEVEDLKDAEVELVVGAPQMKYSGMADPMTYDYITISAGDAPSALRYRMSNAAVTQSMSYESAKLADTYFEESFNTDGEKAGDMYIYKLGKVTLPKKAKGVYPIFAGNVEYKDKYEGAIYDITNFYNTRYVGDDERNFDIFHSLELKNTSSVPFTTASIMVVNEKDQFIAQDELKYTQAGSSSSIRLSKAIDIVMKNTEEEKSREDNAKKIGKQIFSKVTLKGTINIANYQDKEVTITITKNLNGTVTATKDGAKVTAKRSAYNSQNPSTDIKWEVKLAANEKKDLNYEYEVLFIP